MDMKLPLVAGYTAAEAKLWYSWMLTYKIPQK
ncbi:hypothetical protein CCP3SC15_110008 [Gammaproteobacteria bacterium]